ncbi:hypothetical protein HYH03_013854 [Edaphochlamys debaryana]|uniref:Uncharacterized protein n=1 Tax=Edaphochlamys debaryana TaxID=47281 RepID=A0A835XQ40_9CHLO|nr:hypothetical protein HYH03_013854 [Edaphochlamys debaryana]|eukprot:KAG2487575.1 hypothetical protein HYH03_013854 [Edaphochlamys debaryana]
MSAAYDAEAGLGPLLTHRDLCPQILEHFDGWWGKDDRRSLRQVNKALCELHDQQVETLELKKVSGTTPGDVQEAELVLLGRGCRPKYVHLHTNLYDTLEMQQSIGCQLLLPFAELKSASPLPTRELRIDATALSQPAADLIAAAFPELESIEMPHVFSNIPLGHKALGAAVKTLLSPGLGTARLTSMNLHRVPLSPSLGAALSGATQLTKLASGLKVEGMEQVTALASLRSLEALSFRYCEPPELFSPLLTPLTGLRSLSMPCQQGELPAAFSCLTSLELLVARSANLRVDTLSQLAGLEELRVARLTNPPAEAGAGAGLLGEAAARWTLPTRLKEVHLTSQAPEVLQALRYSPVRQLSWELKLTLSRGLTFDKTTSALTEEGESALCSAADFLAGRLNDRSRLEVSRPWRFLGFDVKDRTLVLPVGGAAEAGPGRRNHTAWLEALGRAGVPRLELDGFALSNEDMAAMATNARLKELKLPASTSCPVSGLLLVAAHCRELGDLELYADSWCIRAEDGSCQPPPPPDVCDMLLELNTKYLHVHGQLSCDDLLEKAARLQLHESIKAQQGKMRELGGNPGGLYLSLWDLHDPDSSEGEWGEEDAGGEKGAGDVGPEEAARKAWTARWMAEGAGPDA